MSCSSRGLGSANANGALFYSIVYVSITLTPAAQLLSSIAVRPKTRTFPIRRTI